MASRGIKFQNPVSVFQIDRMLVPLCTWFLPRQLAKAGSSEHGKEWAALRQEMRTCTSKSLGSSALLMDMRPRDGLCCSLLLVQLILIAVSVLSE